MITGSETVEDRFELFEQFERAFDEVDELRVLPLLDLTDDEKSELIVGIANLPEPILAACRVVLDDWHSLDSRARAAALLTLANALAARDLVRESNCARLPDSK